MKKIILDLCGGTGSWSKPYKEAGYKVFNLTLPDNDIMDFTKGDMPEVARLIQEKKIYGILAAPPCVMFSLARTKAKELRDLKEGMKLVKQCLYIIWSCLEVKQETKHKTLPLKFWALENPNGMLKYFLGKPAFGFNPYEFGDEYKKETYLWGWFDKPLTIQDKADPVRFPKFDYMKSKDIHPEKFGQLTRQERRAITPAGFAEAFFRANQ